MVVKAPSLLRLALLKHGQLQIAVKRLKSRSSAFKNDIVDVAYNPSHKVVNDQAVRSDNSCSPEVHN